MAFRQLSKVRELPGPALTKLSMTLLMPWRLRTMTMACKPLLMPRRPGPPWSRPGPVMRCAEITPAFGTATVTSQSGNFVADEIRVLVIRRCVWNAIRQRHHVIGRVVIFRFRNDAIFSDIVNVT
jgi:hypothetical protein